MEMPLVRQKAQCSRHVSRAGHERGRAAAQCTLPTASMRCQTSLVPLQKSYARLHLAARVQNLDL